MELEEIHSALDVLGYRAYAGNTCEGKSPTETNTDRPSVPSARPVVRRKEIQGYSLPI